MKIQLLRPDDLLNLQVEAVNVRLGAEDGEPVLLVADTAQPALLIFSFPPQAIAERAYFNDGSLTSFIPPLDLPGFVDEQRPVVAKSARSSRLVFEMAGGLRIPFSLKGLLDWSKLTLRVSPIAAIGPNPSHEQISAAPAIRAPAVTETAIELPYRLVISPTREVAWEHRFEPLTAHGRTELWHTRLQSKVGDDASELSSTRRAPLRAIWSPDFREKGVPPSEDLDLGLTAMSPLNRHEIVILTSAFHGYEIPPGPLKKGAIGAVRFSPRRFIPRPVEVEQLMLSPLGGWLRSQGDWEPPRRQNPPVRSRLDLEVLLENINRLHPRPAIPHPDVFRVRAEQLLLPDEITEEGGDRLDLSQWVHIAAQGRDHYVRIVTEGILLPLFNRAAEIKETVREFHEVASGLVVASQVQRFTIVVREPVKEFLPSDRGMPYKNVRLTTLVTPFLAKPQLIGDTQSYWVEVSANLPKPEPFRFHAVGTDIADGQTDTTIPMIFVPGRDLEDSGSPPPTALDAYNKADDSRRNVLVPGQHLTFAKPAAGSDNTRLVTHALTFTARTSGPQMLKASVKIPQVEELLGTDQPAWIRFYEGYINQDFDAATGVFAEIVKEAVSADAPFDPAMAGTLRVDFSSDQAGGFATPNLGVSTLSRALGPLAGKAADAIADKFDPATFFPKGTAKLFGSFDLTDLIAGGTLGQNAPKLTTSQQNLSGVETLVAELDWQPATKEIDSSIASFKRDAATSRLKIRGRIEKPLATNGAGPPPANGVKSEFTGRLNGFTVEVLRSVSLKFVEFQFEARHGQKTEVKVTLDPDEPIKFQGDLKFVEELRKAIPPDLFGKGPSIDISPAGIRAGFAIALPPISVGVFALKDVNLGAALTLPFLDGKPVFDFNVSERARPFLLAVGFFGGGGFFGLQLDTAGIKQLQAAFEFGVTAALDIGVASGEVHMMAGIYFAMQRKETGTDLECTLSGYLRVGGSLCVLGLIEVSVEFNLSFTYNGDKAYGKATLTVKVSIAFFSTSVALTVERGFGGQDGDPKFVEFFDTPQAWNEYALAFA